MTLFLSFSNASCGLWHCRSCSYSDCFPLLLRQWCHRPLVSRPPSRSGSWGMCEIPCFFPSSLPTIPFSSGCLCISFFDLVVSFSVPIIFWLSLLYCVFFAFCTLFVFCFAVCLLLLSIFSLSLPLCLCLSLPHPPPSVFRSAIGWHSGCLRGHLSWCWVSAFWCYRQFPCLLFCWNTMCCRFCIPCWVSRPEKQSRRRRGRWGRRGCARIWSFGYLVWHRMWIDHGCDIIHLPVLSNGFR